MVLSSRILARQNCLHVQGSALNALFSAQFAAENYL